MLKNSIKNLATEHIINLVSSVTVAAAVLQISREPIEKAMLLLKEIQVFTNVASPVICSMYAMGGNLTSAVVNNYGLIVFLSMLENICIVSLESILGICMGLAVASSFIGESNLLPLSNAVKKTFTFIVGMMMILFTTVISTQTLLASKADNISAKTAKMLATQIIPLVGGTIGETLRTAGASIEYLRSNVGVILIVILVLMANDVHFSDINRIFEYRTVGGKLAFESLQKYLQEPSTYLYNRQRSVFDYLIGYVK